LIPQPSGIESCARVINSDRRECGWGTPPSLYSIYSALLPRVGRWRAGMLSTVAWPIPGDLFAIDPIVILTSMGKSLIKGRGHPIQQFARRCAGPAFAGIAFATESKVDFIGNPGERERSSDASTVCILDCSGRYTVLCELKDGRLRIDNSEDQPDITESEPEVAAAIRNITLGILHHCPDGTADLERIRGVGVAS